MVSNGPVYDDIIFDPTSAANPPEYRWTDGKWNPVKREDTPIKADLAQGAALASLVAVVKVRSFCTILVSGSEASLLTL